MKFDYSLKGYKIVEALKKVLESSASEKFPMIILWDDEPKSMAQMHRYVNRKKHCIFLRLGVTCNGNLIFQEIYHQLTSKMPDSLIADINVREISEIIRLSKQPYTFIVTNCHLIELDQISWLTGLMIEFDLKAKFVYLLHPDHFSKRFYGNAEKKDPRVKYFFKRLKTKYVLVD